MELVLLFLYGIIVVTCVGLCLFLLVKIRKAKTEKKGKVEKNEGIIKVRGQTEESFWQEYKFGITVTVGALIFWSIVFSLFLITGWQPYPVHLDDTQDLAFNLSLVIAAIIGIYWYFKEILS